jgi:broad specificity phosphatase PhoE
MGGRSGEGISSTYLSLFRVNQKIYLIRHAETDWSLSGRHTGITDLPLTKKGERETAEIKKRLSSHPFELILCSPLKRAKMTCEIAGLLNQAHVDPNLAEWNYGDYEGLTTQEIWQTSPKWDLFSDGAPHGESPAEVHARANKVLSKIQKISGDVALFSHGHFLRALTTCWLHLPIQHCRLFSLSTCSLSILGFEKASPSLLLWNATFS